MAVKFKHGHLTLEYYRWSSQYSEGSPATAQGQTRQTPRRHSLIVEEMNTPQELKPFVELNQFFDNMDEEDRKKFKERAEAERKRRQPVISQGH